ncbi:BTB/POZ domain-containing protein fbl11 [Phtheirospermum japonicum]|uniref:BTB/POZ domain-containing protein fbl11 n=1 Tax=Phtheirospermum japonicum TaxID=374723 RepID=A0A830BW32_9LAMI|nr:BTB/POZ domain-containing protein fbl11 [Phtheirospermum japonicum]
MFPSCGTNVLSRKIIKKLSVDHSNSAGDDFQISRVVEQMLTFESVQELDISNCPSFSLESAIDYFSKLFPSLRSLRAAYFLNLKTEKLWQLVQKLPLLSDIDLTMDINPVIPAHVSITASSSVLTPERSTDIYNYGLSKPLVSNIIKLTLEGRTNISDCDLLTISEVCCSLSYVNIKGCPSVTDPGISVMILKCKRLQSIMACDTSFGNCSIMSLCSGKSGGIQHSRRHSSLLGYKLLTFHVGGCYEISGNMLSELMYRAAHHLRSLCLRESQVVNVALDGFSGSSLEMLNVSDTEVRSAVLCHVIYRNPGLKILKMRGCRNLLQQESELCNPSSHNPEEFYSVLGNLCKLEEIEVGWGFSFFSLGALKPALRTLRTFVVGLGGSLGPDGLNLLPTICPMLETLILYFQVISDSAIASIITNLPHLQVLSLCHCLGDISSLSFKFRMPNLRNLKLERVTRWMTNEDLATLAENCVNLVKLSLIGCTLLDSEAQDVISSGWPGLTYLHLEECGEITANGVTSLLDCHALEDLLMRHNGPGIPRNFIIYAASKLPMIRKVSLDICDAKEGHFDIPSFADRYFLSIVKITRCKLRKSALELQNFEARRSPVHKETLVLVWNSEKLVQTVVKERL